MLAKNDWPLASWWVAPSLVISNIFVPKLCSLSVNSICLKVAKSEVFSTLGTFNADGIVTKTGEL
jgi:hypothetical protein